MRTNISIIIPYHNGIELLESCLTSIISTTNAENEIIVLINNKDKNVHKVDFLKERVKYISVYNNLGYSKAVNTGIEYATNEYIVVCDQDIQFMNNWLDELWISYKSGDNIGIAGVNLINHIDNTILDFGIASTEYNFMHPNLGLSTSHPLVSSDRYVRMICSAAILFSKTDFLNVGRFYEPFGTLYSDLDFCLRFKAAGFNIIASYKSKAYHFSGEFYPIKRDYKNSNIKGDIKGVFMKRNAHIISYDASHFFEKSFEYYKKINGELERYFVCNMMTVANPEYYENLISSFGAKFYDTYRKADLNRDSAHIDLFTHLGRNILLQGVPIAFFVDRFTSLTPNHYWWANRRNSNDIIIDRNANILKAQDIVNDYGIP